MSSATLNRPARSAPPLDVLADAGHRRTEDGDPDTRPYLTGPRVDHRTGQVVPEHWWCFTHEQWEPRPHAPTCRHCGAFALASQNGDSNYCLHGCTKEAVQMLLDSAAAPPSAA